MRLVIHESHADASLWAAWRIAGRIREFAPSADRAFALGLPTGDSPRLIYRELARMAREGELSFDNVTTFNMDEYAGLPGDHPQSYRRFMQENLFDHVGIDPARARVPNGAAEDLERECREYEQAIAQAGGIELFLGGMGSDGHIAFNEPGSSLASRTRVKTLNAETRAANARFFGGDPEKVPATALTVGVGTVMDAREVMIIVGGRGKARALKAVVEEGVSHMWTLSCLQMHPRAIIACDEEAAEELTVKTYRHFRGVEKGALEAFAREKKERGLC